MQLGETFVLDGKVTLAKLRRLDVFLQSPESNKVSYKKYAGNGCTQCIYVYSISAASKSELVSLALCCLPLVP